MIELHSNKKIDKIYPINEKPPIGVEGLIENSDLAKSDYEGNVIPTIVADSPNSYNKDYGVFVSDQRFIKFIPSEEAMFLLIKKPNAFRLLTIIAQRARRENGHPDGLTVGQCHLGDWKECGLTEQEYRTAKDVLKIRKHIKIVETCRTRKKSTTGTTTVGTLVELISLSVYDINSKDNNDRINDRATTEQRPSNDEQEGRRMNKKEEEVKEQTVLSCVASPPFEKIEKVDGQGKKFLLSREDLITTCVMQNKGWTIEEIDELWNVLAKYQNPLRDWVKFCDGTVQNMRKIKKIDGLKTGEDRCPTNKFQQKNNAKKKSEQKPTSESTSPNTSGRDTWVRPFAGFKSLEEMLKN